MSQTESEEVLRAHAALAAELAETRKRLERVLGASPGIVVATQPGPEYEVTYVSPNVADTLGYEPELVRRAGFWIDRVHPDDRSPLLGSLGRLAETGTMVRDCRVLHADGRYLPMRATLRMLCDDSGDPVEITGHWVELSEPRAMTDEVDRFFRVSLDLLCIRGADGYFKRINPAFSELLGYTRAELMRRPIQSFLHPDDVEPTTRLLSSPAPSSAPITFEDRWLCADGSYRWLAWRAIPFFPERLFYAVARDVTEDRRHEAELRRAKRVADLANRAKGEFLANMSHEIRTPMNGVIGMTELTLETELTDQQREYLHMVHESAGSLLETINSILDFSKIEAGRMELEAIDFTLWETVSGALKPLALLAHGKRVELLYEEAVGVPERLCGDPGRLRQALTNLVGNAVKFTHEGTVRVTVSPVETDEPGVRLRFDVADTGIGIPAEKLDHVFESFAQVDGSMSRRFGGTGLGLAITAGLVELMDGRIVVDSEEGRGSSFSFTALFREASGGKPPARPGAGLQGLRVLAVDDHGPNRAILADFCRRMAMEVSEAESGDDALGALDEAYRAGAPIDLVLLDCHMPEMDGFELAGRIRADARFSGLVMVAITAAGRPGDGARCTELGIASYLLRPVAPSELRNALRMSLSDAPPGAERPPLVTRHSLRAARRPLNVLVAEDNRVNQQLALHVLTRFGHTVRLARTGREVLQALDNEDFDVVLMDVQMPEMDGIEATRAIREREVAAGVGRRLPIIAMTAHAMVGDRERFLAAGMDDYVSKPVGKDRLRDVLRGVEGRKSAASRRRGGEAASPASRPTPHLARPPVAGRPAVYDREVLLERMESDVELIATLLTLFESDGPELLAEIDAALAAEDGERVERAAHTLKGAVGVFAADPARERAELVERLARGGALAEARGAYELLRSSVEVLLTELRSLVVELEARPEA